MARPQETFNKKELEKKRLQKRKEKEQRREERKANAKEGGSSLEDMMAYVDENGNITSTPPDPTKKKVIKESEILLGARKIEEDEKSTVRTGTVTFFNTSKGFGFIKDSDSKESIFVHSNGLLMAIKENDKVTFETERGFKGLNAIKVKVIK